MLAPSWTPFRFSLRTLLIICVLPVPFLAWIASVKLSAVRQRQAINHFQARGFNVGLEDIGQSSPSLLKRVCDFIDPDIMLRVNYLETTKPLEQADIPHIPRLQGLSNVHFYRQGVKAQPGEYRFADADVQRIASIQSLAAVTLDTPLEAESLRNLPLLPLLDSLVLPQAQVDSRFLEAISQKPRMAALEFNGSRIDRDSLSKLAKLPLLQTLVIHNHATDSLYGLKDCRALTGLVLWDCKLSLADAEAMETLRFRTLDLVEPIVKKGFFRKLANHPTLVRISVQVGATYHSNSSTANGEQAITLAELEYCEDHFTTEERMGK